MTHTESKDNVIHTAFVENLASERYLLDEMSETEREAFEAHFFECAECADDVRAGGLMREGAAAGFASSRQLAPVATFPAPKPSMSREVPAPVARAWYRSSALPWAVAATLAVVVGYQTQGPAGGEAARSSEPVESMTPVLLHAASRGEAPVVSVAARHVALELDLDARGATSIAYELRDSSSTVLSAGRAAAPAAGAPLLVLIPTFTLTPQQQYILTVRDDANPSHTLGDFRFAATP